MKTFPLHLSSPRFIEEIPEVVSLVARDQSGSFGILVGASFRVTVLSYGLVTLRTPGGGTEYLGVAGGVFTFIKNVARIATMTYVRSRELEEISARLDRIIQEEELGIRTVRESLQSLDFELMKRLLSIGEGRTP